jgi:putative DNA primase/helicase
MIDIFEQQARFNAIPGELKALHQFVAAKVAPNPAKPNAKPRKPPVNVHSGHGASPTKPITWGTFEKAVEFIEEWHGHDHSHVDQEMGELTGPIVCPGFVVTSNDPFCFIDLDGCVDASGTVAPWALEIVEALASYTEISLSGTGLHVLLKGHKPGTTCKKKITDRGGEIEIYDQGRYVAITGNVFEGRDTIEDRQSELEALYQRIFSNNGTGPERHDHRVCADATVTAETVLARAMKSKQGPKLQALLEGSDADNNDDTSAADQAACNIIAFYCGNISDDHAESIIDQIIRESGRYRKKWDDRRGDGTYGSLTIREALAKVKDRYATGQERTMLETADVVDLMKRLGLKTEDIINAAYDGQKGCAALFIKNYMGRFCFDHAAGTWHEYMGHYWTLEDIGAPIKALDRVQDMFKRAEAEIDGEIIIIGNERKKTDDAVEQERLKEKIASLEAQRKALGNIIKNLNALNFRKQVCEFSAQGPGSLGISGEEWDRHPWLLPCSNGVLDLKTGTFTPGHFTNYLKAACPTAYVPTATCPTFERALSEIFNDDQELIDFIRRYIGMALVGANIEHVLGILYGGGRNGKDTLLEIFGHVLGDDLAGTVQAELLLDQGRVRGSGGPSADIMRLRGRRLVWASETNEGRRMDAGKVKLLTGGGALVGRPPYGRREVSFDQSFTLFLLTNAKPRVPADDYALWKRLKLIPFNMRFIDNPTADNERLRDKHLPEKLKAEAEGILAWMVRGCLEWQQIGLKSPQVVENATLEYRDEEDLILQFVNDACVTGPMVEAKAAALYQHYREWAQESGLRPMSSTLFGRKMADRYEKTPRSSGTFYMGVGIKSKDGFEDERYG